MFSDPKANMILEKGPSRFTAKTTRRISKSGLTIQYCYDPVHGYDVEVNQKLTKGQKIEVGFQAETLRLLPYRRHLIGRAVEYFPDAVNFYNMPSPYWLFRTEKGEEFRILDHESQKIGWIIEARSSVGDMTFGKFDKEAAESLLADFGIFNPDWKVEQAKAGWIWKDRVYGTKHQELDFKY